MPILMQPDTTVILYEVPRLHYDAEDSVFFGYGNEADQLAAFNVHKLAEILSSSYHNYEANVIRISVSESDAGLNARIAAHCNYMSFRNKNYENLLIFAFVVSIRYINNVTLELRYVIDSVQTCMTKMLLHETFIERQHAERDRIGDNRVPEPIGVSNYHMNKQEKTGAFTNWGILFLASSTPTGTVREGSMISGVYSGLTPYICYNAATMNNLIDQYTENGIIDNIVSIYMYPTDFIQGPGGGGGTISGVNQHIQTKYQPTDIAGYTPRNKKLLTYPYTQLHVQCPNGAIDFDYNDFDGIYNEDTGQHRAEFVVRGDPFQTCSFYCKPTSYQGANGTDYSLIIDNIPTCTWVADSYQAWVAMNKTQNKPGMGLALGATGMMITNGGSSLPQWTQNLLGKFHLSDAVSGGLNVGNRFKAGGASGGLLSMLSAGANLLDGVQDSITSELMAHRQPDPSYGSTASGVAELMLGVTDFYFYDKQPIKAEAQRIDSFFDLYGYAQKTIAVPNLNCRDNYTYIKTVGLNVEAEGIPEMFISDLRQRFEKGIRFWRSIDMIGDYSSPNNPLEN